VAISNTTSPDIIWGLGGPEEDHQLHQCCWTGRVGKREEDEEELTLVLTLNSSISGAIYTITSVSSAFTSYGFICI